MVWHCNLESGKTCPQSPTPPLGCWDNVGRLSQCPAKVSALGKKTTRDLKKTHVFSTSNFFGVIEYICCGHPYRNWCAMWSFWVSQDWCDTFVDLHIFFGKEQLIEEPKLSPGPSCSGTKKWYLWTDVVFTSLAFWTPKSWRFLEESGRNFPS